ncbi:erythromycin esterase family protein [Edaphobacter sp. HDX4]|uniref:erythromycin esterase family protein n=1 Tax=Edaphobacter sp. HDX4 TaxID=2794064 RepID=UPI002FE6530C
MFVISAAGLSAQDQVASPATNTAEIEPIAHILCGKQVALLGEPPIHGFGYTLEFKVQLVRRLVDECHYNAIFVESGVYDYIHIERELRSGHDVSESMISAAIGGLWANREVEAMVPFLRERVKSGRLTLGGLDDQIGAGSYASLQMAPDLVQPLHGDDKARCLAILQRHLLWKYTKDAPYGPQDKNNMLGCLSEIQTQLSSAREDKRSIEEDQAMIDSLQRNLARDFTEDDFTNKDQKLKWLNDRDRSMYLNYKWLLAQLPPKSKVIVWAATVHTAKNLSGVEGDEGRIPFGSYIHNKRKDGAFSLGFSAYSGQYAFIHQPIRRLGDAPPSSLEAQIFAHTNSDVVYLSGKQLKKYNSVAARPLGTAFTTAHWDRVMDGLVLFRAERAPAWMKHPNP